MEYICGNNPGMSFAVRKRRGVYFFCGTKEKYDFFFHSRSQVQKQMGWKNSCQLPKKVLFEFDSKQIFFRKLFCYNQMVLKIPEKDDALHDYLLFGFIIRIGIYNIKYNIQLHRVMEANPWQKIVYQFTVIYLI